MEQRSRRERLLWAQFDALELGRRLMDKECRIRESHSPINGN